MIRLTEQYQKLGDFEFALGNRILRKNAKRFTDSFIEVEQLSDVMYRIWVDHPTEKYTYMRQGGEYSPKGSFTTITLDNSDSLKEGDDNLYRQISFNVKDKGHILDFYLIPQKWGDYVIMLVDVLAQKERG